MAEARMSLRASDPRRRFNNTSGLYTVRAAGPPRGCPAGPFGSSHQHPHSPTNEEDDMRADKIMTRNPATVPIEATVLEAARLMAEKDVGFLPLVDKGGNAIGTVTDRDIVIRCVAKGLDPRS